MTKQLAWKCVFVLALATCGILANDKSARADGYYFYGAPYYLGPVYSYHPYYPPPMVNYGYGYVAGPPVWNMEVARPAYYYPESFGWSAGYFPAYPSEVKYKFRLGYVKVEIDD